MFFSSPFTATTMGFIILRVNRVTFTTAAKVRQRALKSTYPSITMTKTTLPIRAKQLETTNTFTFTTG